MIMPPYDDLEADPRSTDTNRDTGSDTGTSAPAHKLTARSRSAANEHTEALFTSLYKDLLRLARREVRRNGAYDVLGTGTLVHETWLDISKRPALDFDEPGRFLAYAARTMRGLVIDRVRSRHA